jgi:hypothetical protein
MNRTKWIDRKFTFDFPEGWIFNIKERLHGTVPRIKELTNNLSHQQLTAKTDDTWSIQEHIGHLLDLEELHEGRIDDFISRKNALRAADMSNKKTNEALYNNKSLDQIINEFSSARNLFILKLNTLDDETQHFKSLHPRLQIMMRPVDVAYFTAEHDDHHLATIRMLLVDVKG